MAWMGVIFFLSAQPTLPVIIPSPVNLQSILGHTVAYAVLAFLIGNAFHAAGVRHPWAFAVLVSALYGISDEFHQSFVPNRTPDLFDVATDIVGAAIGVALAQQLLVRRARTAGL